MVAARVSRIDATRGTVRAETNGAVTIAAVLWLVCDSWNTAAARQRVRRQRTVGEIGPDHGARVAGRVRTKVTVRRHICFALGELCLAGCLSAQ